MWLSSSILSDFLLIKEERRDTQLLPADLRTKFG